MIGVFVQAVHHFFGKKKNRKFKIHSEIQGGVAEGVRRKEEKERGSVSYEKMVRRLAETLKVLKS